MYPKVQGVVVDNIDSCHRIVIWTALRVEHELQRTLGSEDNLLLEASTR